MPYVLLGSLTGKRYITQFSDEKFAELTLGNPLLMEDAWEILTGNFPGPEGKVITSMTFVPLVPGHIGLSMWILPVEVMALPDDSEIVERFRTLTSNLIAPEQLS